MTVLYIETNFLVGIARGQDPLAQNLLNAPPANLQILIPAPCCMEAFSTVNYYRSKGRAFNKAIRDKFPDLQRNQSSPSARQLLRSLQSAEVDNQNLLNDLQSSLFLAMHDVFRNAIIIPLNNSTLGSSIDPQQEYIKDPTDNLILHCILEHAKSLMGGPHAFITNNTKDFNDPRIKRLLYDDGDIYYFSDTNSFQGWFNGDCRKKPRP